MKLSLLAFASLAFAACPPPGPTPPDAADAEAPDASIPDAGPTPRQDASPKPADVYDAACLNLSALGCPEGLRGNCAPTMRAAHGELADFAPVCVAGAKDVTALRKCSPAWTKSCLATLNRPLGGSAPLVR